MLKMFIFNIIISIITIFVQNNINIKYMDDFDYYCVDMDSECLNQDFDDVDLFGEKLIEDTDDGFGDDIQYE